MELETVNKLFLELSQFATATTFKDLSLKKEVDNYRETLRSIRYIARSSGDLDRIIQWTDDASCGYTESNEETMAELMDKIDNLTAERDELLSALKMARQDIENTRNIFLTYSLDQKFYDNMATYDNLISKYGEKDNGQ